MSEVKNLIEEIRVETSDFKGLFTLLYNTTGGGEVWCELLVGENKITQEQCRAILSILSEKQLKIMIKYVKLDNESLKE